FFFSSRRRHTRCLSDWSSDVCSSDLQLNLLPFATAIHDALQHEFTKDRQVASAVQFLQPLARATIGHGYTRAQIAGPQIPQELRSEERRVGKECKSRWSTCQ